jgi:hypothetical protein
VKWILLVAVALAAVIAVNAALLSYGRDRHDPVGRLKPVASLPAPASTTPTVPTTTGERPEHEDD